MTLRARTRAALTDAALDSERVERVIRGALAEDLGDGLDVTSVATVPFDLEGVADFAARGNGVLSGVPVAIAALEIVTDDAFVVEALLADGTALSPGTVVLSVRGLVRALLTAERTVLNLLCHLSGIATVTRRWVDAVAGTGAVILDTRKTTPGLRELEKYAVRCGGGQNKRMGLYDSALVKDNHVVAAGGVAAAYRAVAETFPDVEIQVECDTLEQVDAALAAGADFLLCDNMPPEALADAVDRARGRARIEATGGLTLERARSVAETGVDYLSVGALTHSAPAVDLGMDLRLLGSAGEG